jgi:hypothetical protein
MKRNLLWALLGWLSLLTFGARAQTTTLAQETFEDGGVATPTPRYGYTAVVPFTPSSTRFFERKAVSGNTYTGLLGTASGAAIYSTEGTYLWAARSVRSTSSSNINSNAAAVLQLNDIAATNYSNLRIVVAFADPSGTSRNTVVNAQRIRLQYSFDGSPWVTAGLIMGNSEQTQTSGYYQEDTAPLDSIPDGIILNQTFQDITANIGATGTTLRVRIVADTRLPQFVFDNVRVLGTLSTAATPTLANLETTAASYTEAGSPVAVTSALTVGYSNGAATTLTGATVKVSANFVANQDRLTLPSPVGNITGSYSSSTGVLTLSGPGTQANYQAALRTVTYSNDNVTTLTSGTRQLSFQVYNGSTALSNTPVRTLNVTASLNPPASLATPYVENFNADGEGLRYLGNDFVSTAATAGFFRATTSPATSGGSPIGNVTFTGWSGGYRYGENTKLNGIPTRTVQLAPVNAAGTAGLKFVLAVGSSSTQGPGASWNPGGYFKLYYRANGGSWTEFGSFTPDANGVLHRGGSADSAAIGPALRYVTFPLPTAAAVGNLDFQLTQLSDGDEELAFDNIRISAAVAPTVTTNTPATSITTTSAGLGGNVTSNGDGTLTERGVVYVVGTGTPTTSNTKALVSTSGALTGAFTGTVAGLSPGTTYTVRAYAINEAGTGYGASVTFTTLAPVGGTTVVTNVSCSGGSNGTINLTPSGGVGPYTFLWSPGGQTTEDRTGLAAGTYTVTITDATGATGTVSATVTQPQAISAGTSQTNIACFGDNTGAASVFTVSGGTSPYTYRWSTGATTQGITGLAAGNYSVTITDANGCARTYNLPIAQPAAALAVTPASQTNIACFGGATGSASVNAATGGTVPYTYNWTPGNPNGDGTRTVTGLTAGTYSVTVTDANGCTASTSFTITQPGSALAATTSQTNVTTNGGNNGSATITVSGGTPSYTYSWSPNVSTTATASNLSAGTYSVTVTDANGCTIARSFTITQPSFTATAQNVTVQLEANGNATLNASSVNNGSTGSGTLTYTIQKIAFGYIPEGTTPLTLTTPNGANFTQIRFASYGTPNNNTNGNYSLGSCNAANSVAAAQNAYVGRSSGSLYASNTDTRNNPVLGDPCGGTPKALAVQVGYSADAASLTYNCTEAGKTQYVLLTVSNGTSTSTSVAQVTVNAPPTATISSVSPTSAQRGATVTVAGTNLSGVSSVTVNGAAATVSNLTATGFTFVVPNTATFGTGSISVATPCAQTLTSTFTVVAPALTATVSTTSASPTSTAPIPFSVTFSQSVGTTFTASDVTVAGGTITSGSFTGSSSGPYTFTVTPSAAGTVTVNLAANMAQDANNTGNTASNSVGVQFQAPTIVVAPASLPIGTQGTAYSQALSASGGTAPYTYAITAGALPTGLSLTNGTLSGTPTVNGTFNFTVTATDASAAPGPYSGSRSYSLAISTQPATAAPVLTTPANGATTNGQPTYAGTAPAGSTVTLYLTPNGGTAQTIGTTTATGGSFSLTPTTALASGTYAVYATAQSSGATGSANSNTNTFTVDATAPAVVSINRQNPASTLTNATTLTYRLTFSEAVTGVSVGDFSLTGTGTAAGNVAAVAGVSTSVYDVTVTSASGDGTLRLDLNNAGTGIADLATNALAGGYTSGQAYTLDQTAPIATISTTAANPTSTSPIPFTVGFSEAVSGFSASGVTVTNGTITTAITNVGNAYSFSITPMGNGAVGVSVVANAAQDAAGNGNPAAGLVSITYTAPITFTTWTGASSTDWFTAANWTAGVPTVNLDAVVPVVSANRYPLIAAGTAQVRNLTLDLGASLSQGGGTLQLRGNLTNNGTFTATAGTVATTASTSQTLGGSSSLAFQGLNIGAAGATLATSASFQRALTLTGNLTTNGQSLTLLSSIANSGGTNVAQDGLVVNNGGVVVGTVTVRRAIDPSLNPGLGYRHYSSPVSNSTVADLTTSGFTPVVNPAFNTDATPYAVTPFPTVFGYDERRLSLTNNLIDFDKGFFSPTALSDALVVGQGYTVNIGASEVVDFQGTLTNGTLTLPFTSTRASYPDGGWQLLGNPYPAPLDYSRVAISDRAGLDAAIYVYSSTSQYGGRYRSYVNGMGNPVLPIGQGFFARVAAGQSTASLTFRNSQRLTLPFGTTFQRPAADPRPLVQLTLQGSTSALLDEAYVYFENGAGSGFEPEFDAEKLANPTGLNLSTSLASGQQLSIDGQPELGTAQRVVPLAVGVPAAGVYTFTASQVLNLSAVPVYLRDRQLGTLTDLRQQPTYQFTVANAAALNTTRFELIFSPQQPLATVPAALAEQVALYPNPAKTQVAIELPLSLSRQPVTAALLDALGRVVRQQVLPASLATHTLPLADLATGVYSLRLTTEKGTLVKKLVIE